MKYIKLKNGDLMPALGLGTWKSKPGEVYDAVRTALEQGYRHFDCAHVYGNEKEIGQAFEDGLKATGLRREDLFITSKLWNNRHRKEQILGACQNTLNDLGLDYLDLYLIHWPVIIADEVTYPSSGADMVSLTKTPLEETWAGMVDLQKEGLTKHIGVSNFSISKIEKVFQATGVMPEVNQVEGHPFLQQHELKTYCDQNGIVLTMYAPLGSSDRPANRIVNGEPKLFEQEIVKNIAHNHECSVAQVLLAWAVCRGTSVIPKSVNADRLRQNLVAADIELSETEMAQLASLNMDYRYIKGDFWCLEGSDYTLEVIWA